MCSAAIGGRIQSSLGARGSLQVELDERFLGISIPIHTCVVLGRWVLVLLFDDAVVSHLLGASWILTRCRTSRGGM